MKVGDLVRFPEILSLGLGIVVKVVSENVCFVSWSGRSPTIETSSRLELISESFYCLLHVKLKVFKYCVVSCVLVLSFKFVFDS